MQKTFILNTLHIKTHICNKYRGLVGTQVLSCYFYGSILKEWDIRIRELHKDTNCSCPPNAFKDPIMLFHSSMFTAELC